jgi:hypothetical protein
VPFFILPLSAIAQSDEQGRSAEENDGQDPGWGVEDENGDQEKRRRGVAEVLLEADRGQKIPSRQAHDNDGLDQRRPKHPEADGDSLVHLTRHGGGGLSSCKRSLREEAAHARHAASEHGEAGDRGFQEVANARWIDRDHVVTAGLPSARVARWM